MGRLEEFRLYCIISGMKCVSHVWGSIVFLSASCTAFPYQFAGTRVHAKIQIKHLERVYFSLFMQNRIVCYHHKPRQNPIPMQQGRSLASGSMSFMF